MSADLDMNSQSVNNALDVRTTNLYLNGVKVTGVYPEDLTELTGLTDTNLVSVADNEFLRYDLASDKWINDVLVASDIVEAFVTQHQAALSITESQISDLKAYLLDTTDTFTGTLTVTGSVDASASMSADSMRIGTDTTLTVTGSVDASASMSADSMRIGTDTGGDSVLEFYDDTNDAWRSIFWDDSENAFFFEKDDGTFAQFGTGSGGGPDFLDQTFYLEACNELQDLGTDIPQCSSNS
jgi:hypothetical protein